MHKNSLTRAFSVAVTLLFCTFLVAAVVWYGNYAGSAHLRYTDSNAPMITAADGFYYLAHMGDPAAPPLSRVAAALQKLTGASAENVAFWLPTFFSAGMALWYVGWAQLLRLPVGAAVLAALAGSLVPALVERTRPGWFDTDPLIAFFWHGTLWAAACAGMAQGKGRFAALPLLLLCGLTLAWLWLPGLVVLPLSLAALGATFMYAQSHREAAARLALLLGLLLLGVLGLLLPDTLLPQKLASIRAYAFTHVQFVLGAREELIYATIEELALVKPENYLRAIGGGILGGCAALLALLFFLWREPRAALYLAPSLLMLVLGAFGERFLYLAALPLGLALGSLPRHLPLYSKYGTHSSITAKLSPWKDSAPVGFLCGLLLTLVALGNMLYFLGTWSIAGHFTRQHDTVAVALRRASPPAAPVWNWWDDGYFLQARTGLTPLFDGGSQSPQKAYIAARPLVHESETFSRRWIRFFALRGDAALAPLVRHWGGEDKALTALERVFAAENPATVLAELPPLPGPAGSTESWLFPEGRAFLYLSQRVLHISRWWMELGTNRGAKRSQPKVHMDVLPAEGLSYTPETGQLQLPPSVTQKYKTVSDAYLTDIRPLSAPWPAEQGIYLVASLKSPWVYVVTGKGLRTLPLRLMAPGGAEVQGFAPVAVDYGAGGAWEVLP